MWTTEPLRLSKPMVPKVQQLLGLWLELELVSFLRVTFDLSSNGNLRREVYNLRVLEQELILRLVLEVSKQVCILDSALEQLLLELNGKLVCILDGVLECGRKHF